MQIQNHARASGKLNSFGLEVKKMLDDNVDLKIASANQNTISKLKKILLDLGCDADAVENIFMDNLIYKEEKLGSDGVWYWYKYYVDSRGRKQGEMRVYFPDENYNNSNILHAIINFKNNEHHGNTKIFEENGDCLCDGNYINGKSDGLFKVKLNTGEIKDYWFKDGKPVYENGVPYHDKDGNRLKNDGTLLYL